MHRHSIITVLLLFSQVALSQTGPAGVGLRDGSSSLELWMDIDKGVTTVNQTSSGGSASDVHNWADQSGNGLSMKDTGLKCPEYISNFLNGHGVMQYVHSNDERLTLSSTISSIGATNDRTFLYVFRFTSDFTNCEIMGITSGNSVDYGTFSIGNDRLRLRNGSSNVYSALNSVTQSTWHVGVLARNGTSVNAWNDDSNIINTTGDYLDWAVTSAYTLGYTGTTLRGFEGEISELIIYSEAINSARRIILENYLAAKYNITLSSKDIYDEDNAGSDFDYEVAGIGRVDASNIQDDSQGTSFLRILNPTNLGNDEFFIWGHNNGTLQTRNTSDVPSGIQARLNRVWRASEVNSSGTSVDVGSLDLRFDLTGLGGVVSTDLRLLVDTDNDGLFSDETPISGASALGSNVYGFSGVSAIGNNMRFTLGTSDMVQTPLPVKLLSFSVNLYEKNTVEINWTTASEKNNDFFTVERSKNGNIFEDVERIPGALNSETKQNYSVIDQTPYSGLSYYRLKQTDLNRTIEYLGMHAIMAKPLEGQVKIYPNPLKGNKLTIKVIAPNDNTFLVKVINTSGKELYSKVYNTSAKENDLLEIDLEQKLPSAIYFLRVVSNSHAYSEKFIIE